jgi:predicted acetylornithine/succinylornithine family transaminase
MSTATLEQPHVDEHWSRRILAEGERVLAPTYRRPDVLLTDGQGSHLVDAMGKRYLDMGSGIAVSALGHAAPVVGEAMREALAHPLHVSNLYHTRPPITLALELTDRSFADRVFFSNSGAEAVEAAIKFARLAGGDHRREIVHFSGSFHGRTLGALAATDRPDHQAPFAPLPGGYRLLPFGELEPLQEISARTAAVLVEPIQGESGVNVAEDTWLQSVRQRCDETGALLVLDEIQCGLGRTGDLWAHSRSTVTPDLMTVAKPLAAGLPIGATLMTEAVASHITPGCHGTTFGGNPFIAAVATRVLRHIDRPEFLGRVHERGTRLVRLLRSLDSPRIQDIRGRGLLIGVALDVDPLQVAAAAVRRGLLVIPAGNRVVRFLPPLTVTDEELELAVELFSHVLAAIRPASEGADR